MQRRFGELLRDWRGRRRVSQLDLALASNVSARHIAFLETDRARPSRAMVLNLSAAMTIPRADRNLLLNAAGFAPVYERRSLDDAEMRHIRSALSWMLERHQPFPGFAIDRHWRLLMANPSAQALLGAAGLSEGDSLLDAVTSSAALRGAIVNWPEVARHLHDRLRTESAYLGGDETLDTAASKLAAFTETAHAAGGEAMPAVVPTLFRTGETALSLISVISQFGSAEDIALADLKVELMFPADEATRLALTGKAGP